MELCRWAFRAISNHFDLFGYAFGLGVNEECGFDVDDVNDA